MIVETDSRVIVMLTRLKEKDKLKCSHYWPTEDDGEKVFSMRGDYRKSHYRKLEADKKIEEYTLRVRLLKMDCKKEHFIVRELEMTFKKKDDIDERYINRDTLKSASSKAVSDSPRDVANNVEGDSEEKSGLHRRIVYHYHYVAWPDSGVPDDPAIMLDYLWDARLRQAGFGPLAGPMTVHCSAGIGRTGTFIALDCLVAALSERGPLETALDVQMLVKILRRQRFGMVQTLEQYEFIYRLGCLIENDLSQFPSLQPKLAKTQCIFERSSEFTI